MSRYEIIAGMMEDPLNLACVMREMLRIERKTGGLKLVPPPITVHNRVFYPTFREFLRMKKSTNTLNPETLDYMAEIFSTGDGIYYISLPDGSEIGPFDSLKRCHKEVRSLLEPNGFKFLDKPPWEDQDCSRFPL